MLSKCEPRPGGLLWHWVPPTACREPTLKEGMEVLGNTSWPLGRKRDRGREERSGRERNLKRGRGEDKSRGWGWELKLKQNNETQKACGSGRILQGACQAALGAWDLAKQTRSLREKFGVFHSHAGFCLDSIERGRPGSIFGYLVASCEGGWHPPKRFHVPEEGSGEVL